jgi:hypothetical protein
VSDGFHAYVCLCMCAFLGAIPFDLPADTCALMLECCKADHAHAHFQDVARTVYWNCNKPG